MKSSTNDFKGVLRNTIKFVFITILFLGFNYNYGQQSKIDSLTQVLKNQEKSNPLIKQDTAYIRSLQKIAYGYIYINIDSVKLISDRALTLSKNIEYDEGIARSLFQIGSYHSEKGDSNAAFEYYDRAYSIVKTTENLTLRYRIVSLQAIEFFYIGDYAAALKMNFKGLDLAKKRNNTKNISYTYLNIGGLFDRQGEYDTSLFYYNKALQSITRANNSVLYGRIQINLAAIRLKMGKTEKLLETISELELVAKRDGLVESLKRLYFIKAGVLKDNKQYDLALKSINTSIDLYRDIDENIINTAEKYCLKAEILFKNEAYDEALEFAEKAYIIANKASDLNGLTDITRTLYEIHKNNGNTSNTLKFLEENMKYSDSLYSSRNRNGILLLKAKNDFEKQQDLVKAENEETLHMERNKMYAFILIILILISTLVPLYINHRKLGLLNSKITEKSKLLVEREKELIKSNQTKDRIFSIIGHDLTGPIGSLKSFLGMHQNKEITDEELLEFSPQFSRDISSIFFTLKNLLNWGKSQMNGEHLVTKCFKLKSLVDDVIIFLESSSNSKEIRIINSIDNDAVVFVDRNELDIVIRNMVSNAIKFTQESGVINLKSVSFQNDCQISITDNGIGMDAKTCRKILDLTQNFTTRGTANESGTGLGLSLCKELVEKNNGKMWVDSVLGLGTSFHIVLPSGKGNEDYLKAI